MKVKSQSFEDALQDILSDYTDEIIEATKEVVDDTAENAKKIVKSHASVLTGKYKRSISKKNIYESLTEKRVAIYAKGKQGKLAHLLENGHLKFRKGINGSSRVEPRPHFKYGDDYIQKNYMNDLKQKIKNLK